ncbi:hypothetical protein ACIQC5_01035 [Paenarthrobacter sp. NPDC092416]|uniref:hypothetical protein n=1 Tax=Paenarthrobacter sp. NPDC092416 TaxID=3364386 RepID=UPI003830092D
MASAPRARSTVANVEAGAHPSNRRGAWRPALILIAAFTMVAGLTYVPAATTQVPAVETIAPAPQKAVPAVKTPAPPSYPISGYFISASPQYSTNFQKLADIKEFGGDTVITFGTLLKPATLDSLPADCIIDGVSCAKAAAGSKKVHQYFTFLDGSRWGSSALKCPGDRKVTSNGKSYVVLFFPTVGQGCASPSGEYDVVVAGGSRATADDPSSSLASAATKLGMKYYAGLPAPIKRTDLAYLPDLSYMGPLTLFTERFLQYHAAVNNVPGLAGFYHHTEMPLSNSSTFDPVLALYQMQNRAIHRLLPTREAIVSPYLDARLNKVFISLDKARDGTRRIAQTSSGLVLNIAVQDGMGTGKGGAFSSNDANSAVDRFAASIVGKGSWASKYVAPNRDYFVAAASGVSGTGAVLWANLEGMAPEAGSNACGDNLRGQTTKARMDRQLQQMANARKVISFMWDSYYTCTGSGKSLKDQLESGLTTPIITDTTFRASTGQVQIAGFNLKAGTARVRWTAQNGLAKEKTLKATGSNAAYGQLHGLNDRLEMITVSVGKTTLNTSKRYVVTVTNEWGVKSEDFFSQPG